MEDAGEKLEEVVEESDDAVEGLSETVDRYGHTVRGAVNATCIHTCPCVSVRISSNVAMTQAKKSFMSQTYSNGRVDHFPIAVRRRVEKGLNFSNPATPARSFSAAISSLYILYPCFGALRHFVQYSVTLEPQLRLFFGPGV